MKQQENRQIAFPLNMGHRQSFELVYRTYYAPLKRFISGSLRIANTDDLVENVFVKLWDKQVEFESLDHMRGYLYRAAGNAGRNYLNLHHNNRREDLEDLDILKSESYLVELLRSEVIAELMRAIQGLPSQCSKVISMAYLEGMSNAQIAEQLNINEQSVKNHKHRGLKLLRQSLSGESLLLLMLMNMVR